MERIWPTADGPLVAKDLESGRSFPRASVRVYLKRTVTIRGCGTHWWDVVSTVRCYLMRPRKLSVKEGVDPFAAAIVPLGLIRMKRTFGSNPACGT